MASLQGLTDDVCGWLNRRDIVSLIPGWITMVETEISETLRARCQVTSATQPIDASYVALPSDFAAMESIRDATTGEMFELKDEWSGGWVDAYQPYGWQTYDLVANRFAPTRMYRLVGNCIEWMPHPTIPDPPDPNWVPQQVLMGWYQKPKPLLQPQDTNPILEALYGVYLFGTCKYGAIFELDDDRAAQMDAQFQQVITRANLWKQGSDYSGAPLRSEMACVF